MREIKFRAWDKDKKQMVIPEIIGLDYEKFIWCHDRGWLHNCQYWDGEEGFSDNFELMQFTGLKDKNGKEIYEGDIIQNVADDGRRLSIFEIRWQQSSCGFVKDREDGHTFTLEISKYFEVIGNLYENPDLLK